MDLVLEGTPPFRNSKKPRYAGIVIEVKLVRNQVQERDRFIQVLRKKLARLFNISQEPFSKRHYASGKFHNSKG